MVSMCKKIKIDAVYYNILLIVGILIFLSICLMTTSYVDIANNIFAEFIGVLATIILLVIVVDIKEQLKWKKVENVVFNYLGLEIYDIYTDLSNLCEIEIASSDGEDIDIDKMFEKSLYGNLNKLIDEKNIIFNKTGKKSLLNRGFGDLLVVRRNNIKDVIQMYFKFLEPSMIKSLIILQQELRSIDLDVKIKNKDTEHYFFRTDETFLKEIRKNMCAIFKEINSLHYNSGLKIYYK